MVALRGRTTQARNPIRTLGVVACMVAAVAVMPACSSGDSPEPAASPTAAAASSADAATAALCPSGGCDLGESRLVPYRGTEPHQWMMEVSSPSQDGPWPVVLIVHGGHQTREWMHYWAVGIARQGAMAYNVSWPAATTTAGESAESLACALRVAVDDAANHGADTSRVIFTGLSLGADIGAAVSLGGGPASPDCILSEGSVMPDAFVGYEGPYGYEPAGVEKNPGPPDPAADPYAQIGGNPDLVVRLLHGDAEDVAAYDTPLWASEDFSSALADAGYDVELSIVPGGEHISYSEGQPGAEAVLDQVGELLGSL